MEDEEGELFDNTYLDELKGGSVTGRESLTFEEIQRRNSMVPPHLRSSYMPQFGENEPKVQHFYCILCICFFIEPLCYIDSLQTDSIHF